MNNTPTQKIVLQVIKIRQMVHSRTFIVVQNLFLFIKDNYGLMVYLPLGCRVDETQKRKGTLLVHIAPQQTILNNAWH